ncbi:tail fiber domain-containing protein [Sinorhizobium meliloti]|uniref:tail fiber domain-containing protein n=1 Tax=Rhizobium meliloti TaxID=382 RepID=UPI000FDC0B91|nr:tail fiber domain-containing protein [Sinorhizobium meliloti]RVM91459.1 hypothetical protein CN122_14775 [Sinorhizobium meliloti]
MSLFTKTADDVFAPYNSDGSPREPVPQEAQVWGTEVERSLLAFQAGGGIIFETKAEMDAALNYAANQSAWVMGDDTVENNGVYRKIGASGVGSWERLGDLPYSFIRATDVGAGTPNAIQATTSIPVSGSALIWMNVFEANTASPVIVSFNGGSALTIKTNSGNDVVAGGLTAGMIVMGIVSGSTFRLVSDQASAAILAACEAARDAALSAVPNSFPSNRAALKAIDTTTHVAAYLREPGREGQFAWKAGDYSAQIAADPLEGLYIKADGVAAASGAWVRHGGWALQGGYAEWFGAVADYDQDDGSGTDNDDAINAALSLLPRVFLAGGYYRTADTVELGPYRSLVYQFGAQSMPVGDTDYFRLNTRACLVPRNLPRRHVINSMITQCELSGGVLANPSAAESYTASSAGRLANYRIMDFTNQDASGATRATQRLLSIAVKGSRGASVEGVSVRTTRANGNFVSDATDTDFGNQCDIGFLGENAFFGSLKKSVITWAFRDAAVLLITDDVTGDSPDYHPQTDRFFISECLIEGHCGFALRGPDRIRISAVTTTTIRVKWFKSHRFASTGSINADGSDYTYSSLTYDAGTQELVFGGLSADPIAAGVAVGDELIRTEDTRTFGSGGVSVNNSFIRSISHPSLKISTDGFFTDFFAMSGRSVELSGLGIRGIIFHNTFVHGREDISVWVQDCNDVYFATADYHEAKFLAEGAGSNVSRFIALGFDAKVARGIPQPIGNAGDIHFIGWSQTEGGTDMRPTYRTASNYGRFGSGSGINDGLFEPSRCSNDTGYAYGNTNFGVALVHRLPIIRGTNHGYVMCSPFLTPVHSIDSSYRQAWGTGQWSVAADLPYAFNFYFGANSIANLANTSSTAIAAWRVENTAGNAWYGVDTDGFGVLRSNGVSRIKFGPNKLNPATDSNIDLGTAATGRYRDLFLLNAPTVTSEASDKVWRGGLTEAELRVARRLSSLIGLFQWRDAIAEKEPKGKVARLHAGVTAQSVVSAFEAEGLDAFKYGLVGLDRWEDQAAVLDEEGNEIQPHITAGSRHSLRPDELWAFMAAGFEARLAALEG